MLTPRLEISYPGRETKASSLLLPLTTRAITGWDRASVGRIETVAVLGHGQELVRVHPKRV